MKLPRYFCENHQQAHACGINPFALSLLAESFADEPDKFGSENVALLAHAHNGQEVWFVLTKRRPEPADFDATPTDQEECSGPHTNYLHCVKGCTCSCHANGSDCDRCNVSMDELQQLRKLWRRDARF